MSDGVERRRLGHCGPTEQETSLLQAAFLQDAAALDAWGRWRSVASAYTTGWRSQLLIPLVVHHLGDAVGADTVEYARARRRTIWGDNQRDLAALREALATIDVDGCLVVKGAALIDRIYPPGLRAMGDIDLVVGADDYAASVERLLTAGWSPVDRVADLDVSRAVGLTNAAGRSVDVHRWVVFPRFVRCDDTAMWSRARPDDRFPGAVVLDDADAIVLSILHGLEPESTRRWPADVLMQARYVAAVQGSTEELWERVAKVARSLGAGRLVGYGLDWCRAELALDVDPELCAGLVAEPLDAMMRVEWEVKRRGLPVMARVRQYVDASRALGTRPTPRRYVGLRWAMFSESGGWSTFVTQRRRRARATIDRRRNP